MLFRSLVPAELRGALQLRSPGGLPRFPAGPSRAVRGLKLRSQGGLLRFPTGPSRAARGPAAAVSGRAAVVSRWSQQSCAGPCSCGLREGCRGFPAGPSRAAPGPGAPLPSVRHPSWTASLVQAGPWTSWPARCISEAGAGWPLLPLVGLMPSGPHVPVAAFLLVSGWSVTHTYAPLQRAGDGGLRPVVRSLQSSASGG